MSSPLWPDRVSLNHYMHRSTFDKPLGLLFGSGELREKSSRLTVKLLHQFEFFKPQKMEGLISFEMSEIESDLSQRIDGTENGKLIFSPHTMFEVSTMNVVCQVLFGKRYNPKDPMVLKLLEKMNVANREFSMGYTILEVMPWLKYFPRLSWIQSLIVASDKTYQLCAVRLQNCRVTKTWMSKKMDPFDVFIQCDQLFLFKDIIKDKRKQRMSLKEEPKDFVDAFLQEIDKQEDKMLNGTVIHNILH